MEFFLFDTDPGLALVDNRARTIIQIETPALAEAVGDLNTLPWDYAYIGLNDLMVAKDSQSIWEALTDGTVDAICEGLRGRAYGFGGATFIGGGVPIVNILILHELVRLGGSVSIMRRTFKRELLGRDLSTEVAVLRSFIECSQKRGVQSRMHDQGIRRCRRYRTVRRHNA